MADQAKLEETLAHLMRVVEELSDVVARQDGEITRLRARVDMLMAREADREAAEGGARAIRQAAASLVRSRGCVFWKDEGGSGRYCPARCTGARAEEDKEHHATFSALKAMPLMKASW
jgi:SlyX protein